MKRVRKTFKKYFIPHEENDHKPHLLRVRSVVFVLLVALAVESVFLYGSSVIASRSRLFGIILTNALVDETNQNRVANGDQPLTLNPLLQVAAQDKANDMVANNYFAHTSPAGITPWDWFEKVGYSFTYAGENLAVNFSDSQDVTDAWMNSAEHRANILNANFTDIGMATATGTFEGHSAVYVVELFGAPAPAMPPGEPISVAAAAPKIETVPGTVSGVFTSSSENFVAVKGAETQIVPATETAVAAASPVVNVQNENNPVQSIASAPHQLVDDIYLAIIALFGLALILNIFIKIRIQHAQVILGGMLVILVAGLFIVLNAHFAAAGTAVL